jgi:undecaprenyl-diphosphatase
MTTWQRIEIGSGERRLCLAMNRWGARRALIRLFRLVSRLGDGVFWYALMLMLALFAGRRGLQAALHMACVGIVAALLYRTLKRWTRRPRPFRAHADITPYIAPLDEFSFPSGHTLHAVSFTLIALAYFPWLAPLLLPFTLLVAMSRVVLGLHYPSDVLAATVIGCALAGSSLWLVPS